MITNEDALVREVLPIVAALRPAEQLLQEKATRQAVSPDGYINERALLPSSDFRFGGDAIGTTDSSSSTSTPKTYMDTGTFTLPDGNWRVVLWVEVTGSLSGASTLNLLARLNNITGTNVPISIAAANQLATGKAKVELTNVPGGSEMFGEVLYRPSAGTATVQCGSYEWRAERM